MKKLIILALAATLFAACGVQKPLTEAQYEQSVRKDIPFAVSEFKQVKPEVYAFKCDKYVDLLPDYEVDNEGTLMIWRTTFGSTHSAQPQQYIWRNVVINKRNCRVLCIDRMVQNGKTFGYVYVLQSETKEYSDDNTYHWDVTDQRLLLNVAGAIEHMSSLSVTQLEWITKQ
jgi:hypothetical protein